MNRRSDVILPHKKFTWADFGGINTDIHPRRYAPVNCLVVLPALFIIVAVLSYLPNELMIDTERQRD